MPRFFIGSNRRGFSLVEFLIVATIISAILIFVFPKYKALKARARQSEVKTNLNHIYTLERNYFVEHGKYLPFGPVGYNSETGNWLDTCDFDGGKNPASKINFKLEPCGAEKKLPLYMYFVEVSDSGKSFVAHGRSGAGEKNLVWLCGKNSPEDHQTVNEERGFNRKEDGATPMNGCDTTVRSKKSR